MSQTPAGWYPDPTPAAPNAPTLRYWDGTAWTGHVTPSPAAAPAGPSTGDGEPLAGWWWRVLAFVLDGIVLGVATSIVGIPAQMRVQEDLEPVFSDLERQIELSPESVDLGAFVTDCVDVLQENAVWLVAPSAILTVLYWVAFLRWKGGTPGKLMLRMRVRLHDRPGTLPWASILARLLVQFGVVWTAFVVALVTASVVMFAVATLVALVMLIDPLWASWDGRRQTLHDKLAGTTVVRRD